MKTPSVHPSYCHCVAATLVTRTGLVERFAGHLDAPSDTIGEWVYPVQAGFVSSGRGSGLKAHWMFYSKRRNVWFVWGLPECRRRIYCALGICRMIVWTNCPSRCERNNIRGRPPEIGAINRKRRLQLNNTSTVHAWNIRKSEWCGIL